MARSTGNGAGFVRLRIWPPTAWLLRKSCPRSATEFVALLFGLTGVCLLGVMGFTGLARQQVPTFGLFWCFLLFMLAAASRLSPWWRAELAVLTPERARNYTGSCLLVLVALSLSCHFASVWFSWGNNYLLMGRLSSPVSAEPALVFLGVVGLVLVLDVPVIRWLGAACRRVLSIVDTARTPQTLESIPIEDLPVVTAGVTAPANEPEIAASPRTPTDRKQAGAGAAEPSAGRLLPSVELFVKAPKGPAAPLDLEHNAQRIQDTLASFNVQARVVGYHCGPVVTQFDVQPDKGVKVRRITELQNDLALALAAPTIRIQAPVPGKPVVGIEIPNASATVVTLRELLEHESYRSVQSPLAVVLGKDVAGKPAVIDLAKMPHLLIAGATGSGKSVCVNALISCLLYQNTPDQVRLLMIDPKMVELTVYNGVPHLLSPVVTQMDKVIGVLQWAIREMERRYQLFADNTVRNITRFNEKMLASGQKRLPYIVLIVDELADLMMVAPEDVEDAICRLAQLARAAGIHLVIATQRPSVDVVTGLIKANFPARIAFAMSSQIDSRTILDTAGAEKLLGRGDMLYMPPDAPKPVRLQGAFLSDQEIERLVEFWQSSPVHTQTPRVAEAEFVAAEKEARNTDDELLEDAIRVVREYQHASVSLLQRRLKVGYSRAARLMDQLEERNIVGAAEGAKQRPVLDETTTTSV